MAPYSEVFDPSTFPLRDESDGNERVYDSNVKKKLRTAESILADIGNKNIYILSITFLLSLSWGFVAMGIMCSAFYVEPVIEEDDSKKNLTFSTFETANNVSNLFDDIQKRRTIADHSTSLFMFGNMIGATILTYASDKVGRKPILICSMISLAFTGLIPLALGGLSYLPIGRFLQGICTPGILLVGWVHAYECIPIGLRGYVTLIFGLLWVIGYCAVAPIAYFIPNWILMTIANTAPTGIVAIIFAIILPESLHFLIVKNKDDNVREWINKAKQYSRNKFILCADEIMYDRLLSTAELDEEGISEEKQRESLLKVLKKDKTFILYLVILMYLWTCDTFVYFGLSLYTTQLAGNMYWNYCLSGIIELPVYLLIPMALERCGRKPVVALTHFVAGLSLTAFVFVSTESVWLYTTLWVTGKFGISCSFMSITVYAIELFPTTIRSACVGSCSIVARIGGILAPYVRLLGSIVIFLPMLFFGTLSIIAGMLTLFLPETRNRPLPSFLNEIKAQKTTDS